MKRLILLLLLVLAGCAVVESNIDPAIQDRYPDDIQKQKILQNMADDMELILTVEDFGDIDLNKTFNAIDCVSLYADGSKDILFLENLVFDTDEKADKYIEFNDYMSGGIYGGEFEEPDCDFPDII
ncbi:hypothetical protein ACFL96_07465 [Thermoproteota archaeon]